MASKNIPTEARDKAATSGDALPDGSFPIRNKGELMRAIMSYGRAKNKPAAKALIIKQAKALGATSMLPSGWLNSPSVVKHSEGEFELATIGDFLMHHGVKGMHWGVRKDRTASLTIRHPSTGELHTLHYNPKRVRVETNDKGEKTLSGDRKEVEHLQRSAANALAKKPGKAKSVSNVHLTKNPEQKASEYASSHKTLSDEELRTRLNRLKMEQEYNKLTAPPESTGSKIKKGAVKAVGDAGQSVATATLKSIGSHAVNELVLPAATKAITSAALKAAARRAAG